MMNMKVVIAILFHMMFADAFIVSDEKIKIEFNISELAKCLGRNTPYVVKSMFTLRQCVMDCGGRSDCVALNYRRQFHLCELFQSVEGIFITNSRQTGQCVFINKHDMKVTRLASAPVCSCQIGEHCDTANNYCVTTVCPKISIENTTVYGNMNAVGSGINFSCLDGYRMVTVGRHSTCLANGTWSYLPKCIKVYQCHAWTADDLDIMKTLITQSARCHELGFIFTRGRNANYPGCGSCFCCKPV